MRLVKMASSEALSVTLVVTLSSEGSSFVNSSSKKCYFARLRLMRLVTLDPLRLLLLLGKAILMSIGMRLESAARSVWATQKLYTYVEHELFFIRARRSVP